MKSLKFKQDQLIKLEARLGHSVAMAVREAIEFCKNNHLKELELQCNGFLFDIEPDSDLREKLMDYFQIEAPVDSLLDMMQDFNEL